MSWQGFDTVPHTGELIPVYREDAGIFYAHYTQSPFYEDGEPCWWSSDGEDLKGDLPTLWFDVPEPTNMSAQQQALE